MALRGAELKAADSLKRHCHHLINTLGPIAPPEAFLFRGNAYYALGHPYFALADYNTAGRILTISGQHQQKCHQAIKYFPETQVATYPSVDSHLHIFVKPFLAENCEVEHLQGSMGRGIIARDNLLRNTKVMKANEPWLRYPTVDGICAYCAEPLPERTFPCSNAECHEEYCSRDCRAKALGLYHSSVCYNKEFQSLELDMYAQMQQARKDGSVTDRNAAAAQLLMMRVISTAKHMQVVPSAMAEIRILSGKLTFSPEVMCESMLHMYERLALSLNVFTIIPYEEMVGVLARVTANCFHHDDCVELNLARAMFNHSCDANVGEDAHTGEMLTMRDVSRGEELTINYYPHLKHLPYAERTAELQKRNFDCQCARCKRQE